MPTTDLPAKGRTGRAPAVPKAYKLKPAGRAWWNWAWKLPQATRWDEGSRYFVVRRAQLEDDLDALESADKFELVDYLTVAEDEREIGQRIEFVIGKLKSLAGGKMSILKEMRELDNRLGLNPKGLQDLRWKIEEKPKKRGGKGGTVAQMDDYRGRLD